MIPAGWQNYLQIMFKGAYVNSSWSPGCWCPWLLKVTIISATILKPGSEIVPFVVTNATKYCVLATRILCTIASRQLILPWLLINMMIPKTKWFRTKVQYICFSWDISSHHHKTLYSSCHQTKIVCLSTHHQVNLVY